MDVAETVFSSSRSPAQNEASRLNGARSQGPVTAEGKARSARNATRHGLCAKNFYLLPDEDPEAFAELLDEVARSVVPQGAAELHWVEEIAFAMWRQKRLRRVSAAIFASVDFPAPELLLDDPIVEAHVPPTLGRELAAMARYRARIDKDIDQAMGILERMKRARITEEHMAREEKRLARAPNELEHPSPSPAPRPAVALGLRPAASHAVQNEPEPAASPAPQAPPQGPMNRQQRRYQERQAQKHHRRAG